MSDDKTGLSFLGRFLKRKPGNHLASVLHSNVIGQPLLCHAELGSQIIQSWMRSPQSQAVIDGEYQGSTTEHKGIAVIDISGPMVARRVVGPSGTGPLSYEDIREDFQSALVNDAVDAIVLRVDSAGGQASQNFDLSDFIYESRGTKPIIGMVDDMAYSGGYSVISACDQVWVTRTSGVGSIGVVVYHEDQTEMNAKRGVKVELIRSGERKVERNPYEPLTDQARQAMQDESDRLYDLFVSTVARNRGMTVEQIVATKATTYHGQSGIDVGLADKLGTFADLLGHLQSEDYDAQAIMSRNTSTGAQASADLPKIDGIDSGSVIQEEMAADAQSAEQLEAALQAEHDRKTAPQASTPTEDLEDLEEGEEAAAAENQTQITAEQAEAQILVKTHAEIRAVCTAAGLPDIAQDYITAGTAVDQVRADLVSMIQAGEVEIESTQKVAVEAPTSAASTQVTAASVYARRNQRGN